MTLLPALTIGLMFGLVTGVLVYYVIGYFEADEVDTQISHQITAPLPSKRSTNRRGPAIGLPGVNVGKGNLLKINTRNALSSCVIIVLDGKAKFIDIPPSEGYK